MKEKIILEENIEEFKFSNVNVKNLINEEEFKTSIAKIKLNGKNEKCINTISEMFYYILKGKGYFIINNKIHKVKKGNLICIPKTHYTKT